MLDKNLLSQLTQLKADIHASKNYATGTVAGTQGRYGFVRMTDGRDAFLAPEKMDRVLPGDEVEVIYRELENGKIEADLEKLIHSPLKRFMGQYRIRGKGHFVVPTGVQCSRWIFIPPKCRKQSKDGDFVITEICQHPFRDSKAQARVVFRIGSPDEPYIEHKYIKAKFDLTHRGDQDSSPQVNEIETLISNEDMGERVDLTDLYFVTIDSEVTMDMDDALAIENGEGDTAFRLHAAIADPSSFIAQDTALAETAQKYAQTVYLSGGSVPMLPKKLSNYSFSLEENKKRPSLVCSINISHSGEVQSFEFRKAIIKSRHKLSYDNVALSLEQENNEIIPSSAQPHIIQLHKCAALRRSFRKEHQLVNDEQIDYDLELNEIGKIKNIHAKPRNAAHLMVEEAMLATNICAGEFLEKNECGLHISHPGFREDRLGEVKALLKEEEISYEGDLSHIEGHLLLIKQLENTPEKSWLLPALRRLMRGGEITLTPAPHLGLGSKNYATVTSPIRRFADLYNHWSIIHILEKTPLKTMTQEAVLELNETLQNGRQADRELHQWLITDYAQSLIGQEKSAKIRIVTQQGFGARITENGIDGFILFPKGTEKTFDAKRMTLRVNEHTFKLEEEVNIRIASIDTDKRRIAFELV